MKNLKGIALHPQTLVFISLVTLYVAWAIASFTWPLGGDHGIFAWTGDVIIHGGLPYQDAWDIKGPLAYYLHALIQFLFGHNMWGIRLFDLIIILSAAYALVILISNLTNKVVARWAAVFFLLWYASGNYFHTAQPDGWVSMTILIAITPLLVARDSVQWYKILLAGILIGCSLLIKPLYLLFWFLFFIVITIKSWRGKNRITLNWIIFAAGSAIPLIICAGWFASNGALRDLIDLYLIYPIKIYSGVNAISFSSIIKGTVEYVLSSSVLSVLIPMTGLGILLLWRSSKKVAFILGLWLISAILIVLIQNRFFQYHWLMIYPPITVISAVGFHWIFFQDIYTTSDLRDKRYQPLHLLGIMLLAVVIFQASIHPLVEVSNWVSLISKRVTSQEYYAGFGSIPSTDIQAADYIQERTKEGDHIYIWGWNASIYYLTSRESISRFGFSMPLLMGEGTEVREAYRREFLSNLASNTPVYIVIAPQSDLVLGKHYDLSDFEELNDIVSTRYIKEAAFGDLVLYRLIE